MTTTKLPFIAGYATGLLASNKCSLTGRKIQETMHLFHEGVAQARNSHKAPYNRTVKYYIQI